MNSCAGRTWSCEGSYDTADTAQALEGHPWPLEPPAQERGSALGARSHSPLPLADSLWRGWEFPQRGALGLGPAQRDLAPISQSKLRFPVVLRYDSTLPSALILCPRSQPTCRHTERGCRKQPAWPGTSLSHPQKANGSPFGEQGRCGSSQEKVGGDAGAPEGRLLFLPCITEPGPSSKSRLSTAAGPACPSLGTKPGVPCLSQAQSAPVPWGLCFFTATASALVPRI